MLPIDRTGLDERWHVHKARAVEIHCSVAVRQRRQRPAGDGAFKNIASACGEAIPVAHPKNDRPFINNDSMKLREAMER